MMVEILKGLALVALGILSVVALDGDGSVAIFTVPAGIYYMATILKGGFEYGRK